MSRYEWKKAYEIGDELIDLQHQQLIFLANLLDDAVQRNRGDIVLNKSFEILLLYTERHFADEEAHFSKLKSSLLEQHSEEHRCLAAELLELRDDDALGFAPDMDAKLEHWVESRLVPHMIESDQEAVRATVVRQIE